jgi:ketosteroid isomerase-like protein/uncharacterized protein YndB with AHSA1/START domain
MSTDQTAEVIRSYYDAWTTKDFTQAESLLAPELAVEVPVNEYPTTESFAAAVRAFGSMARKTELLSELSAGDEGMLLYDMQVQGLEGTLRVVEHFTVQDGKITRVRQIHDTAALRAAGFVGAPGYTRRMTIRAPRERVFDAIGTVDGPRHWWTTVVTGSADAGGELRFGFAGLPEQMVMRVEASRRPQTVRWTCVDHTREGEWTGTRLRFELSELGAQGCELDFSHSGLPADVVARGWEHFLGSLAAYAEQGAGTPFGAE